MLRGARGVIIRNEKVLLGKRLNRDSFYGLWCTFGGGVEAGETPEQALKRELNEELGIEIVNPKFLTVIETVAQDDPGETAELHYLVRLWEGEIVNRSEHSETGWFSMKELEDLDTGWVGREVIRQLVKSLLDESRKGSITKRNHY